MQNFRDDELWLVADIGGTNTRCALCTPDGRMQALQAVKNDAHASLAGALGEYLKDAPVRPARAALAVAAPVTGDRVSFTNRSAWAFSQAELRDALSLTRLEVLNDFTAVAHCVPRLGAADIVSLGGGPRAAGAPIGVLGPGTGLGVSGLMPAGGVYGAIRGEGGHITLAAHDDFEAQIIAAQRRREPHVSAETFLCGTGLPALWQSVAEVNGAAVVDVPTAEAITAAAAKGDALAGRTMDVFFAMLGTFAGNLALTLGALGGVYLAGGILPGQQSALAASRFRERFEDKGQYSDYLKGIPTGLIVAEQPGLLGLCARIAARSGPGPAGLS